MSFLASNFNLCVLEIPKENSLKPSEVFDKLIEKKFVDILPSQEKCHGWVSINNIFKSDFGLGDVAVGSAVAIGYRFDIKKVSNTLVKKLYIERLKARARDGEKISKDEKKSLKEACREEMVLKALPNPYLIGCIIDTDKNLIYLDSTNTKAIDSFRQLFQDTFGFAVTIKNYGLEVMDDFLEWVWIKASSYDRMWLDQIVVFKEESGIININNSSLTSYIEKLEPLRQGKKIKKLGLTAVVQDLDYLIMFNDKDLNVTVKSTPKIKHENVETAIIDNVDRINSLMEKIKFLVTKYLED